MEDDSFETPTSIESVRNLLNQLFLSDELQSWTRYLKHQERTSGLPPPGLINLIVHY